jgi:hypothetical protein
MTVEPVAVPMRKPMMVERKVKPISVKASPSVKNVISVVKTALGFDQKKPSIQPWSAAACHNAMTATMMPICVAMMAQSGQSFCTGRRRILRAGRTLSAGSVRALSRVMRAIRDVSWIVMRAPSCRLVNG